MHLERLTLILEIVGQKDEASVADICAHSDLPRPTAYRLVNDLVNAGLLDPVGQGRFAVGNRLKRITESDQSDAALVETIAPVLRRAAADHGATFFLSRLRGKAVEIIHVETPDTGVSYLHPGLGKRPLHACSCSKAVAAFSPNLAVEASNRLKSYTEFTVTDVDDLTAEFANIRGRGFAECVEELERGMCSVAAPLHVDGQTPTLSIGATGPVRVFTAAYRDNVGAELISSASDLTERLGWATSQPSVSSA